MRDRDGRGFTLIEILVVVLIIAIASGIAVANLEGDDRGRGEREAKRLAGALEHAAALAQWQGETLGVSVEGGGYRFWRRNGSDKWITLDDDAVLAPHPLPIGFTVTAVSYAGAPVPENSVLPFRPSGRNEPYALLLSNSAWSVLVAGDPLNRVQFAALAASP